MTTVVVKIFLLLLTVSITNNCVSEICEGQFDWVMHEFVPKLEGLDLSSRYFSIKRQSLSGHILIAFHSLDLWGTSVHRFSLTSRVCFHKHL